MSLSLVRLLVYSLAKEDIILVYSLLFRDV
jgi:hypothetical protein